MNPEFICDAKQELKQYDVDKIIKLLKDGGLCILPSDSSYILTGLVTVKGISKDIDLLLERNGAPMSLAFCNLKKTTEMINFHNQAYEFFKRLTPGGLTFVLHPAKNAFNSISENYLYADGTIGVRLTESLIETQIAGFFPMPSTPIRNSYGMEVSTAKEAWEIIAERSKKLNGLRKIALIDAFVKNPGRLSTVVNEKFKNGYWYINIIREGAISTENIKNVALKCKYKGVFINE